jgi:cardiolipin synthase
MLDQFHVTATAVLLVDLGIRIGLSVRVIKRRLPVGVALAWLFVILILPLGGALLYLLFGEYRLGRGRTRRAPQLAADCQKRFPQFYSTGAVGDSVATAGGEALARVAEALLGAPPLPGNRLELLPNAEAAFPALLADIDRAARTCDLEFYIWSPGGCADEVARALIRAATRGVSCRVLVDAIGSKAFLRSPWVADLRNVGVQVQAALTAGALRLFVARPDLRLHRKFVVIDGTIGYTGSLNLADPKLFKQHAGVGQWVDALARVQGPAVGALALTFLQDWALETGAPPDWGRLPAEAVRDSTVGPAPVQVLPTGPDARVDAIAYILLSAAFAARQELVLTTPYFVPGEAMVAALISAAARGAQVTLIVPARIDSRLVGYASRAFQADLIRGGVRVALYQGGLLHTKSMTVDGRFCLFGSVNLDPRSLRLDFEITLAVYDEDFTRAVRQLQQTYVEKSVMLNLEACASRSALQRFLEDAARLFGPVL